MPRSVIKRSVRNIKNKLREKREKRSFTPVFSLKAPSNYSTFSFRGGMLGERYRIRRDGKEYTYMAPPLMGHDTGRDDKPSHGVKYAGEEFGRKKRKKKKTGE